MQKIISRDQEPIPHSLERAREFEGKIRHFNCHGGGKFRRIFLYCRYHPSDGLLWNHWTSRIRPRPSVPATALSPITSAPGFLLPSGGRRLLSNKGGSWTAPGNYALIGNRGNYRGRGPATAARDERIKGQGIRKGFPSKSASPLWTSGSWSSSLTLNRPTPWHRCCATVWNTSCWSGTR